MILILFSILFMVVGAQRETVVVNTESGPIRGRYLTTDENDHSYAAFTSIPYAQPPLGNLRFKPAVRASRWRRVLNTTTPANECPQGLNTIKGDEDCLYINVYTTSFTDSKPVIVWVHGGGFLFGSGNYQRYNPSGFLEMDVVFVSFNYRLGILGFISTLDDAAVGNYGLGDQILALQWIQENIAKFGGDKNNVVLFGESAGAASVSYLTQIDAARDLFHKAIMNSGTSLCPWSLSRIARTLAFRTGERLGIQTPNSTELVERLRDVPFRNLTSAASNAVIRAVAIRPLDYLVGLAPVTSSLFGTYSYEYLIEGRSQNKPMIFGFNSEEAVAAFNNTIALGLQPASFFNTFNGGWAPIDLNLNYFQRERLSLQISYEYMRGNPITFYNRNLIKLISDTEFVRPVVKSATLQAKISPTYLFMFSFSDVYGSGGERSIPGVAHAEELAYIFGANRTLSERAALTRRRILKLYTNFAHFGSPTPQNNDDDDLEDLVWPPIDPLSDGVSYLNINETLTVEQNPFQERIAFWETIYQQGNRPYGTY